VSAYRKVSFDFFVNFEFPKANERACICLL